MTTTAALALTPVTRANASLGGLAQAKGYDFYVGTHCSTCHLRELHLPCGLTGQDIDRLDELVYSRKRVKRGQTLYRAGDPFHSLYALSVVVKGNRGISMDIRTKIKDLKLLEVEPRLSDQFYLDCLNTLGDATEDAAMILDDHGEVLFCNCEGAAMLGKAPNQVAGSHISEFILNMRLNAWTPGSNVAYAAYTGSRDQWREYCVLDSAGRAFPVELLLDVLVVNLRYLILLWVRTPARPDGQKEWPTERQSPDGGKENCSTISLV